MLDGILPLILVLLVIAFVMYMSFLFTRFIGKRSSGMNRAQYMKVIDRLAVGQDRFLMIVELQDKHYLVSATAQEIRILKELDGFEVVIPQPPAPMSFSESFKTVLGNVMQRKK